MHTDVQNVPESRHPSIMKRAVAGLVLVAVVVLALHFIVSLVFAVFWFVVAIAAVVAVLWALKTIFWQLVSGSGLGLLVICFFFGVAGGIVGRVKGSSFVMWFLISACVPFIGLLTAILYRFENQELRRQCPRCHRVVRLHDAVCMTCGEEFAFPETAVASEAAMRDRQLAAGRQ